MSANDSEQLGAATTRRGVPCIEFQRAAVAFDTFCREVEGWFVDFKDLNVQRDLTPDMEQLEAMLIAVVRFYVLDEAEAVDAVRKLVEVLARPSLWPHGD